MAVLALALLFGALATLANGNLIPPVITYIQDAATGKFIDKPGHPLMTTTPAAYILARVPLTNLYTVTLNGSDAQLAAQSVDITQQYVNTLAHSGPIEARYQNDLNNFVIFNPSPNYATRYLYPLNSNYLTYASTLKVWRFSSAWTTIEQGQTYAPPSPMTVFTATAIIKVIPGLGGVGRIFDKISYGGNNGWLLDLYQSLNLRVIISPGISIVTGPVNVFTDYHIGLTYDGTKASLYINGYLYDSRTSSSPMTQNNLVISVGRDNIGSTTFPGIISRAQIFPIVLTPDQVLHDYQNSCGQATC